MLKNAKTEFFVKKLFSFINEKRKLILLKYDKSLQKKLELTLLNYEIFSSKYILYDSKTGKGKEYDINDNLLFEGEYFKGKRNGKGKEYDDFSPEYVIFEGEYLNGKRNGKGIEYDLEKNKIFEGEYLNGKKWNGKGYDGNDNIVYEIKNGNGYIKEFGDKKLSFECQLINGEFNGKGKLYEPQGKILFEGEYLNGKKNGKGKEYDIFNNLIFEGEYFNDKKWNGKLYGNLIQNITYEIRNGNGFIKEYLLQSLAYEGEYISGERNGKGKEYNFGKLVYKGEFLNGKRNGKGEEYDNGN